MSETKSSEAVQERYVYCTRLMVSHIIDVIVVADLVLTICGRRVSTADGVCKVTKYQTTLPEGTRLCRACLRSRTAEQRTFDEERQ